MRGFKWETQGRIRNPEQALGLLEHQISKTSRYILSTTTFDEDALSLVNFNDAFVALKRHLDSYRDRLANSERYGKQPLSQEEQDEKYDGRFREFFTEFRKLGKLATENPWLFDSETRYQFFKAQMRIDLGRATVEGFAPKSDEIRNELRTEISSLYADLTEAMLSEARVNYAETNPFDLVGKNGQSNGR